MCYCVGMTTKGQTMNITHHPHDRFALLIAANGMLCRPATADEIAGFIAWEATQPLSRYQRVRPKRKSERTHLDVVLVQTISLYSFVEPHDVADVRYSYPDGQLVMSQVRKTDLRCLNETEPMLTYLIAEFGKRMKAYDQK